MLKKGVAVVAVLVLVSLSAFLIIDDPDFNAYAEEASTEGSLKYNVVKGVELNGSIHTSASEARAGSLVLVTYEANPGYRMASVSYVPAGGDEVFLTAKDGTYEFRMPSSAVTVNVKFVSVVEPDDVRHFYLGGIINHDCTFSSADKIFVDKDLTLCNSTLIFEGELVINEGVDVVIDSGSVLKVVGKYGKVTNNGTISLNGKIDIDDSGGSIFQNNCTVTISSSSFDIIGSISGPGSIDNHLISEDVSLSGVFNSGSIFAENQNVTTVSDAKILKKMVFRGQLTIPKGVTLTICPDAELVVEGYWGCLDIRGTLIVDGLLEISGTSGGNCINRGAVTVSDTGEIIGTLEGRGSVPEGGWSNVTIDANITKNCQFSSNQSVEVGSDIEFTGCTVDVQGRMTVPAGMEVTIGYGAYLKVSGLYGEIINNGTIYLQGSIFVDDEYGCVFENNGAIVKLSYDSKIYGTITGSGVVKNEISNPKVSLAGSITQDISYNRHQTVTVTGDLSIESNLEFRGNFIIPAGVTVTVKDGGSLNATGKFANGENLGSVVLHGSIVVDDGSKFCNNGDITVVSKTYSIKGNIIGDGTYHKKVFKQEESIGGDYKTVNVFTEDQCISVHSDLTVSSKMTFYGKIVIEKGVQVTILSGGELIVDGRWGEIVNNGILTIKGIVDISNVPSDKCTDNGSIKITETGRLIGKFSGNEPSWGGYNHALSIDAVPNNSDVLVNIDVNTGFGAEVLSSPYLMIVTEYEVDGISFYTNVYQKVVFEEGKAHEAVSVSSDHLKSVYVHLKDGMDDLEEHAEIVVWNAS